MPTQDVAGVDEMSINGAGEELQQEKVVDEQQMDDEEEVDNMDGNDKQWTVIQFDPVALKYIGRRVDPCIQHKYTKIGESCSMSFKLIKSDSKLVKALLYSYGFIQCSTKNQWCNLLWTNTHLSATSMRQLRPWQRVNHFPRSWMLTRKDLLYENLDRAAIQYGQDWFNFIPEFFCTPLSGKSTRKLLEYLEQSERGQAAPLIVKPVGGSFGRGIFFLDKAEQISSLNTIDGPQLVISRYIDRPYLINGLKWDLRIYVLVTSFHPLIAYIYSEGLARFAVNKYEDGRANLQDVNQHLTNYSLNKQSDQFVRNTDCTVENMGHKWSLGALLRELQKRGVDTGLLMVRIEDIVIKSLLAIQPKVATMCRKLNLHPNCCFELFGFDVLVDEDLKPWLLELNLSPSLTCDSPLDALLKTHLFSNVLNIAQIPLVCYKNGQNKCYWGNQNDSAGDNKEDGMERQKQQKKAEEDEHNQEGPSSPTESSSVTAAASNSNSAHSITSVKTQQPQQPRASKVRRVQLTQRVNYSADRITALYLARVNCLFDKLKSEEKQRGNFNRIFPRRNTFDMYSLILEDGGQERWDEALHVRMTTNNGDGQKQKQKQQERLAMRDIRLTHEQLMDAAKFKHRSQLDPVVRDTVLAEALRAADCYQRKMYAGDLHPFPSSLPKVRPGARRRTKSQTEVEEVRRKRMEQNKLRAEEQQQQADDGTSSPGGGGDTSVATTAPPLSEVSLNLVRKRQGTSEEGGHKMAALELEADCSSGTKNSGERIFH